MQVGRFRADLFHRLYVYPITVPPLRERAEDIPLLASHFSELTRRRLGLGPVRISAEALDILSGYGWPGNVRELENVLSRAILKAPSGLPRGEPVMVDPVHLGADMGVGFDPHPAPFPDGDPILRQGQSLRDAVDEFQRGLIRSAIERSHGNWAAAARELGMHRSNLHNLALRLGVRRETEGNHPEG